MPPSYGAPANSVWLLDMVPPGELTDDIFIRQNFRNSPKPSRKGPDCNENNRDQKFSRSRRRRNQMLVKVETTRAFTAGANPA